MLLEKIFIASLVLNTVLKIIDMSLPEVNEEERQKLD